MKSLFLFNVRVGARFAAVFGVAVGFGVEVGYRILNNHTKFF